MSSPLSNPASVPAMIPAQIASGSGNPRLCQEKPSTIELNASTEPTERSIPPVMIMKVIGSAMRAISRQKSHLVEEIWRREKSIRAIGKTHHHSDQHSCHDHFL